ncbi:MAG: CAP domain-containing protein, partial [Gemmobacter sp.]
MARSAAEQLFLELMNRARLDPLGEAARFGIGLNDGLSPGRISSTPKQVLAYNPMLEASSLAHSEWMLATRIFSHYGANNSTANNRMEAAGYRFTGSWAWGENLSMMSGLGTSALDAQVPSHHRNLFLSAGHRVNLLNDSYREAGAAFATDSSSQYLTVNFGLSGSRLFLTGVAHTDRNGNRFYDIGEAIGGVSFSIGGASSASDGAGGYAVGFTGTGWQTVTVSLGARTIRAEVLVQGQNVKLDYMVDSDGIGILRSTAGIRLLEPLSNSPVGLEMIGIQGGEIVGGDRGDLLIGNRGNNRIDGGGGNDTIRAGDGSDTIFGGAGDDIIFGGDSEADIRDLIYGGDGNDWIDAGWGNDEVHGGNGDDTIFGGFGADTLIGNAGNDVINGGPGSDLIFGGPGDDWLNGGFGHDRLNG